MSRRALSAVFVLIALITLQACGPGPQSEPAATVAGPRVENAELGLVLTALPAGFSLDSSKADGIFLNRPDDAAATLAVTAGEVEYSGIDLTAALREHKEAINALPGGDYRGQLELNSHIGRAYLSRGRYTGDDGSLREEHAIFAVHPGANRRLILTYRYPAGDQESIETRRGQLMEVLGAVETLGGEATEETQEGAPES